MTLAHFTPIVNELANSSAVNIKFLIIKAKK